ncbi:OsmC family protein [Streptosporangium sp. OZ121]|uniref:OsmC family protein n=1 Tax=Streptosporangium sp. OZ121 TaxID=3444183 RepID=UPI003F7A9FB5
MNSHPLATVRHSAPDAMKVEVEARSRPGSKTQVSVRTSGHEFVVDEPSSLGGDDAGASPIQHLLAALGASTVATYRMLAGKLGIPVDDVQVRLSCDVSMRGPHGELDDTEQSFGHIHSEVTLTGPESPDRYRRLAASVDDHCPVLDALYIAVTTRLKINSTGRHGTSSA